MYGRWFILFFLRFNIGRGTNTIYFSEDGLMDGWVEVELIFCSWSFCSN